MLYQRKKLWDKYIDLTVETFEENSERLSFQRGEDGSLKFIYRYLLYYMEGSSECNRMVVDAKEGREGGIFNFFADIINHLPIRSTSRVAKLARIKFYPLILWSFVISPELNIMYTLSPNFLRATRMMSLRVFLISWNRLDRKITPR